MARPLQRPRTSMPSRAAARTIVRARRRARGAAPHATIAAGRARTIAAGRAATPCRPRARARTRSCGACSRRARSPLPGVRRGRRLLGAARGGLGRGRRHARRRRARGRSAKLAALAARARAPGRLGRGARGHAGRCRRARLRLARVPERARRPLPRARRDRGSALGRRAAAGLPRAHRRARGGRAAADRDHASRAGGRDVADRARSAGAGGRPRPRRGAAPARRCRCASGSSTAAEGNPFFAEEIALDLDRHGDALPDTVRALLAARIDALPAAEKAVLQHAAVVGRRFWAPALEPNRTGRALGGLLRALEERGLIVTRAGSALPGARELWFAHGLTREVAYRSIPRGVRARTHADVAAWLERLAGDRRDQFAGFVAHHREAAAADRRWAGRTTRRRASAYVRRPSARCWRPVPPRAEDCWRATASASPSGRWRWRSGQRERLDGARAASTLLPRRDPRRRGAGRLPGGDRARRNARRRGCRRAATGARGVAVHALPGLVRRRGAGCRSRARW